jgi:integrase
LGRRWPSAAGARRAWDDNDLVFANEVGRPIEAASLRNRSFWPLLERAGLPRIRFHDLRHTAATLMLGRGVHPKVVAEAAEEVAFRPGGRIRQHAPPISMFGPE